MKTDYKTDEGIGLKEVNEKADEKQKEGSGEARLRLRERNCSEMKGRYTRERF